MYDKTSNSKSFLLNSERLSRNQQWSEEEQHDQFYFSLEGAASDYNTLLMETNRDTSWRDILCKFGWWFKSTGSCLMHKLNFQYATQNSRESLRQWADGILTLATYAFPGVPDVHVSAIPHLFFFWLRTKMLACMPLMVNPRLWWKLLTESCTSSSCGGIDWSA